MWYNPRRMCEGYRSHSACVCVCVCVCVCMCVCYRVSCYQEYISSESVQLPWIAFLHTDITSSVKIILVVMYSLCSSVNYGVHCSRLLL